MAGPRPRLLSEPGATSAYELLGSQLSGADARSLLLEIAAARAAAVEPADLLRQYRRDRFCAPAPLDALALAEATAAALRAVSANFEPVALAPLAPLATSSALGPVPQNNVVTSTRLTDVAADPTNALALEAAVRRTSSRSTTVRLAAVQRVVRAQRFDGPRSYAHFSLLGLVSAGRDVGHRTFEVDEIVGHIAALASAARAIAAGSRVSVRLSDLSGRTEEAARIAEAVAVHVDDVEFDLDRTHGTGYYEHLCVKVHVGDPPVEVGDGCSVSWTQRLLADRKERLVISGLSLDRLVLGL